MQELFVVEMWRPLPFNIEGEWVYTLKSNEYDIAKDHKDFMESMGFKVRLIPELH